MIVITGAAGFIGSIVAWKLNQEGHTNLILCDKLGTDQRWKNIAKRRYQEWVDIDSLHDFLAHNTQITAIIHLGACSSTTEEDMDYLMENNTNYTKKLFTYCTKHQIPFIYASSAATYGNGEQGYDDNPKLLPQLNPLNKYGYAKHVFDIWAMEQKQTPKWWVGLKFFNVYGPNEYHKGTMASMVFHSFNQANKTGEVKLFKSDKKEYPDGGQLRDFIYVKDVADVILFFLNNHINGIFNVGTGKARSFADLAKATMQAIQKEPTLTFIPMPDNLKPQYQYYTQATMDRLKKAGYTKPFHTLEEGVQDYVSILQQQDPYL